MKRVLIIDDSTMILDVTRRTLEAAGFAVSTMTDPSEFNPTDGDSPDLILVDINMPQFYGDDVVTYFQEEWLLGAPVYLFSNVEQSELEERAKACGADGFISKGWGLERLLEIVQEILKEEPENQGDL